MTQRPQSLHYAGPLPGGGNGYRIVLDGSAGRAEANVQVGPRHLDERGLDTPTVMSDLDAQNYKSLLQAVADFDKAGHVMMFEHGDVEVVAPCTMPEKMRPVALEPAGSAGNGEFVYRVTMRTACGEKTYSFDVSPDGPGLSWEKAFFKDMGGSTQLADPLLDAILDFFAATNS